MTSLVEQNFTLVLKIANAIIEGRANPRGCAIALSAQADQVSAELRDAEAAFDAAPDEGALRRIVAARAAFCGQVAGERLVQALYARDESRIERALETFDPTAKAIVRYLNERANGDESGAVAAIDQACSMLPPDRRAMLSPR